MLIAQFVTKYRATSRDLNEARALSLKTNEDMKKFVVRLDELVERARAPLKLKKPPD
jgi:hypothetical protein